MPLVRTSSTRDRAKPTRAGELRAPERVWLIGTSWRERGVVYWTRRALASTFLLALTALFGVMLVGFGIGLSGRSFVGAAVVSSLDIVGVVWGGLYIGRQLRTLRHGKSIVRRTRRLRRGPAFGLSSVLLVAQGTVLFGLILVVGVPFFFGGCLLLLLYSLDRYAIGEPPARIAAGLKL